VLGHGDGLARELRAGGVEGLRHEGPVVDEEQVARSGVEDARRSGPDLSSVVGPVDGSHEEARLGVRPDEEEEVAAVGQELWPELADLAP
jgi:hypothetical protein